MSYSFLLRVGEPSEVAAAVIFLASDASSYFTESNLVMDGGTRVGEAFGSDWRCGHNICRTA